MKTDSGEIRALRAAFVRRSRDARLGEDCPSPELIWAAVHGELSGENSEDLVEHTAFCPGCAEAWRLARDFSQSDNRELPAQAQGLAEDHGSAVSERWYGRVRTWAFAAAALIVVAVGINLVQRPEEDEASAFRSLERNQLRSLIPDDQVLARDQTVLRWTPGPEGSLYNIWVATEDLDILTSARGLEESQFPVPASILQSLPAGARIVWQVEVRAPDGQRFSSGAMVTQLE